MGQEVDQTSDWGCEERDLISQPVALHFRQCDFILVYTQQTVIMVDYISVVIGALHINYPVQATSSQQSQGSGLVGPQLH